MGDIIIDSFLKKFSTKNNLLGYDQYTQFEMFTNFLAIYNEYNSTSFNLTDTLTGRATQGIDGIAIIVNGKICTSVKEIEDLIETTGYLDAKFVLIQAKTSSKFDSEEIGGFFRWTKTFFKESSDLFSSEEMQNFIEMKSFIYNNADLMVRHTPICELYFMTTGTWNNDDNLMSIVNESKEELEKLNMFKDDIVNFTPCGSKELQELYRKTTTISKTKITLERRVTLPKIKNVDSAYSGVLPFSEFKKIIIDRNGNIKSVFEDNIRDYLETTKNAVNKDIEETIKSNNFEYFCILNNGITVVADKLISPGEEIVLENYQIVNGCQTSHVLYENKDLEGIDKLLIPVKIIATKDINIKGDITRATNNQTAVSKQELEALTHFQKTLEEFYEASNNTNVFQIFYERRTNQYKQKDISLYKIVNIEIQVKVFSSMFLDLPHNASGHHGKLLSSLGDDIFNLEHSYYPYYISGLIYCLLEEYFLNHQEDKMYKKYRFHLVMIARYLMNKSRIPDFTNQKATKKYCKNMQDILIDTNKSKILFKESIKILIDEQLGLDLNNRKTSELSSNTKKIQDFIKKKLFINKEELNLELEIKEIKDKNKSVKKNIKIEKKINKEEKSLLDFL